MYTLYSVFLFFFRIIIGALALFDSKIRRGIEGRKELFTTIQKYYPALNPLRKRILIHVSSFGELEQAKPIIGSLKEKYPEVLIHLTFFSPSGYDNAFGTYTLPDIITYLPFDSRSEVNWFLDIVKPHLVLFVRYDLWHNLVHEIHDRKIPMLLFSATFDLSPTKSLPFIRNLYKKTYSFIDTIFTISESDKNELQKLEIRTREIIVAGDTRCDQVIARRSAVEESDEKVLPETVIQKIAADNLRVFIAGSTWENDERIVTPVIKEAISIREKFLAIIVPHEVDSEHITDLVSEFGADCIVLSKISDYKNEKVIIVDSIGKLFALYKSASFAFVGGGFSAGVHNILEPAVWGVPSIVGPNHARSKEIAALIGLNGAVEIRSREEFEDAFANWFSNDMARNIAALAAKDYVFSSAGAKEKIMEKISIINW